MELWRKTWRIGFAGWQGGCGISTVGDVEEFFARVCHEADERLKEVAGCRWFLNWYDDTPRAGNCSPKSNRNFGVGKR